jgi:hypothetical protein
VLFRRFLAGNVGAASTGYSGKPVWQKLGLAGGQRLVVVSPPAHLEVLLRGMPDGVTRLARVAPFDVALVFVTSRKQLASALARLPQRLAAKGMIWIAWPKKSSGVATDVSENVVRDCALPLGLVDVKVCAIDETWSGLKLLRRRQ